MTVPARGSSEAVLMCRIGTRLCALPLACVSETMRPLPVEPVPGAPDTVLGIAMIRGLPTPVLDGSALLGLRTRATRFVTLRVGARIVALAVDAVLSVESAPQDPELPPLTQGASAHAIAAIGVADRELVFVLEGMKLLPGEVE